MRWSGPRTGLVLRQTQQGPATVLASNASFDDKQRIVDVGLEVCIAQVLSLNAHGLGRCRKGEASER